MPDVQITGYLSGRTMHLYFVSKKGNIAIQAFSRNFYFPGIIFYLFF